MAAIDYVIVEGWMNAYLTKKNKPTNKRPHKMSEDHRIITDEEIIGLFEFYLRKWCVEHKGDDTVVISNSSGKKIFQATLFDKWATLSDK